MKFTDNPFMILLGMISIGLGAVTLLDKRITTIPDERVQWALLGLAAIIVLVAFLARVQSPVGMVILAIFVAGLWVVNYFKLSFPYRDLILFVTFGVILITLLQSILSVMQIEEYGRHVIYGVVIVAMLLVYGRGRRHSE